MGISPQKQSFMPLSLPVQPRLHTVFPDFLPETGVLFNLPSLAPQFHKTMG